MAKKESKVVVFGPAGGVVRNAVTAAFRKSYPEITLEYVGGRAAEQTTRIKAERDGGVYSVDVFIGGVVAAYLLLTTWIGHALSGRNVTIRDFFLGGRKLPWYAVSGSIIATEISALTFVSVPWVVFQPGGNLGAKRSFYSATLLNDGNVLIAGGNLIRKVLFPAEVLPIVTVLAGLAHFCLGLPILAAFLLYYGVPVVAGDLIWFPLIVVVQLVLTLGLALLPAILYIAVRGKNMRLNLMISYGGRAEIIRAVQSIAEKVKRGELDVADIDEKLISSQLYTADTPDPDLLIRTSGEQRISNFLLWELAYSELVFTPTLFPDFRREHFFRALLDFQRRERRYGAVTKA